MRATFLSAALIALILFLNASAEAANVHFVIGGGQRSYGWQDTLYTYGRAAVVLETEPNKNETVYGAVIGYTGGNTSFSVGNADYNRSYTTLYARTAFMGGFLTLAGSFGPVTGTYSVYGARGKSDTESFAFSALYNHRMPLGRFWLESQTFFLFTRVNGYTSIADSGAATHQEDFDHILGQIQFSVGKDFPKCSASIRAACLHDLRGELKVRQTIGNRHLTHSVELGGTWWRTGLVVSYKLNTNTSVFASLDKLWGGSVGADWQFGAGLHTMF